jgi:riboflavin kinase/FMN adenylyltransferase
MRVARGLENLDPSSEPSFVVVGVFDGLHLGHAYLLDHLVTEARRRQARPVVITFDHHPDEILTGSAPPLLCDPDERLERLEAAGVDATVVVHFDQRLRETTYDGFVGMIAARGPIAGFLMTPDAAFGYQRGGTPDTLAELGRASGFGVVVVPPFELSGHPVRSTEVRLAIAAGDLALAARLLGRALPVALPPDGAWAAIVTSDDDDKGAEDAIATVAGGVLELPGTHRRGRLRVSFLGPASATRT